MESQLINSFGAFYLARYPQTSNNSLRAWDAADEYLLEYLAEQLVSDADASAQSCKRALLVNDTFGALSCALSARHYSIHHWSDSLLSQLAVTKNFKRNDIFVAPEFIKSTDALVGKFDAVLIKIPKTTALLEHQLLQLRPHIHDTSVVVAAGMVRNLNRSSFQCFEKILGPITTSLAKKKARLIFPTVDSALQPPLSPYPGQFTDSELGFPLIGHANVFSRDRLDAGARFFLSQFGQLPDVQSVVDLGCGNGVLGIAYQRAFEHSEICFVDESFMAIESARAGYEQQFGEKGHNARFIVNDGLSGFSEESVDLILCNPPFHQQHAIAEQSAHAMFVESERCLRRQGELWVVANRHLRYQTILKRLFGRCSVAKPGPRFNLYRASKSQKANR